MRASLRAQPPCIRLLGVCLFIALTAGCGDDDSGTATPARTPTVTATPTPRAHSIVLFGTEGERLNAYDVLDGFRKQAVVSGGEDEHAGGISLNGQVCFAPDGSRRFAAGDDAGQREGVPTGWSVFQLNGSRVGEFTVTKIGRLSPTYQAQPDNFGCAFLRDGRLLTTDIGNNRSGAGTGQLIVWFPPLDQPNPRYCKLDITIGTAGGIYVDGADNIYVASARANPGVYRYRPPFPTAADAAGGCGRHDGTGAALADAVTKEIFIHPDAAARTPNAIVASNHGTFFVTSVFNGAIGEYGSDGTFIRRILSPPAGEVLGPTPYSTGTPFGIAIDSAGSVYYADLGLVSSGGDIGPGRMTGTFRRIRFADGAPLPPETIDRGLSFPDGVGVLED